MNHAPPNGLWISILALALFAAHAPAQTEAMPPVAELTPTGTATNAPAEARSPLERAAALETAGQADEALAVLQAALAPAPDDLPLLHACGALQRRQGNHQAAADTYAHIVALNAEDPIAKFALALILRELATKADAPAAVEMLQRAATLSDYHTLITIDLCTAAARAKQSAVVVQAYNKLNEASRRDPALARAAADAHGDLGQFEEAVAAYEALLASTPTNAELAEALAQALLQTKPEFAAAHADAWVARFPTCTPVLRVQASMAARSNDPVTALRGLSRLLALSPSDAAAATRRVALLTNLGCLTLAQEDLTRYGDAIAPAIRTAVIETMAVARRPWAALDGGRTLNPPGPLALPYGDIVDRPAAGSDATPLATFIESLEYLRAHDFHVIGARELAAADRHHEAVPNRTVLLVFHGAHASFTQRVLPLLELYGYPAILALASGDVDRGIASATEPSLSMTWPQIREVAAHPLVTLASMTHNLGTRVPCNPQGRLGMAAISRVYNAASGTYESATAYRERITADLTASRNTILRRTNQRVDILVWPEGACNSVTLEEARGLDYTLILAGDLKGLPAMDGLHSEVATGAGASLGRLIDTLSGWGAPPTPPRASIAMPVDLNAIPTESPEATRNAISAMLKRVTAVGADTVTLSACADDDHDGSADRAFFPNSLLPVKADLLDHVSGLLRARGIRVHVVAPPMALQLPGTQRNPRLLVSEYRWGRVEPAATQPRLSPFNPEARRLGVSFFDDLAAFVAFDGLRFDRDAYLTASEDAGPDAAKLSREKLGLHERNPANYNAEQRAQWSALKLATLDAYVNELQQAVRRLRPATEFARSIEGPTALTAESALAYAQDYATALATFDTVWVNATPEAYGADDAADWLTALAAAAGRQQGGLARTVFDLGMQDEDTHRWMSKGNMRERARILAGAGARQLAYHPDLGGETDEPRLDHLRTFIRIATETAGSER